MNSSNYERIPKSSIEESSIIVQSGGGMYRLRGQGTFSHCSFVATTTAPLESNLIFQSRNGGSKSSETSTWTGDVVFVLAFFLFCPAAKDSRS
ncbi:hypothetical protein CDL15_Pgr004202 [Punica granatum]|uniref:Uncharacterized protein n=1 Tax=Punica granatum TaxID=22663 RepID=A0A218XH27_PUNGR|nr:hypothetical protein CDL15_Pgr004202 [Punica granatum]